MSKSFNQYSNFFSSLKQVEKRLKLEEKSSHSSQTEEIYSNSEVSLSSPIHLHNSIEPHNHSIANHEDSEVPLEFLSNSWDFTPTQQEKSLLEQTPLLLNLPKTLEDDEFNYDADNVDDVDVDADADEIGSLIELLGLSENKKNESNIELGSCDSCRCDSGFLGKIAGVKGPKCNKELERLEGWICHFRNENIEPLRLAHLLLGKAAVLYGNSDGGGGGGGEGFEGLEFPSTVEEFLRRDPPSA